MVCRTNIKCYLCRKITIIQNIMSVIYNIEIHYTGIIIAICTFLIIGLFHPIVIKMEYYSGTKYWWTFLLSGFVFIFAALFVENVIISSLFGVTGASLLWANGELFSQKKRVKKGWFPMNPKRRHEYEKGKCKHISDTDQETNATE